MKKMQKKAQKGFSLVELMVVIAIIAILAAVAIPMYSNYTMRAKVGAEIAKAGGVKADVSELISDAGSTTITSANITNLPVGVTVSNAGVITIAGTGDPLPDTASIILTPTLANNTITWACTGSGLSQSQLPATCTVAG